VVTALDSADDTAVLLESNTRRRARRSHAADGDVDAPSLPTASHSNTSTSNNNNSNNSSSVAPRSWRAVRGAAALYHNQLIAALTASVLISYADRTNMSLTVLEIMRELRLVDAETGVVDPEAEGLLLASFFCGYILTQVPGGWAAQVWGGRRVLAAGSVIWSVCTFLIPLAAAGGFWWILMLRVGLGIGEGVCFPAIHVMISRWVPDKEKSRAVALVTAGAYLGNVVALGVSGGLINSPHFGWRWAFYVFGLFGILWNFGWHFFAREDSEFRPLVDASDAEPTSDTTPDDHAPQQHASAPAPADAVVPLETSQSLLPPRPAAVAAPHGGILPRGAAVPWKALLWNRSAFAMLVNFFCYSWGFYVLVNWLPTYFQRWEVNVDDVAWFAIAPYFVQGGVGVGVGFLADYLVARRRWSLLAVRQLAQGIGMFGPAAALFVAAYGVDSAVGGMVTMTVAMGLSSCTVAGHSALQHDIAPQWAGVMFAVGNMVATVPGIVGVASSGWLLEVFDNNWAAPLGLAAALHLLGGIVWVVCARTTPLAL
jgi:MFS family permease